MDESAGAEEGQSRELGSRYQVFEILGRGGMGSVYRGTVKDTGEPVAIKILRSDLAGDQSVVARFLQERSILTGVSSPHLVAVRDMVIEGQTLAIVMELVQGKDLRRHLVKHLTLEPAEAVRYAVETLQGLATIHEAGIVHRDVKPENILIDQASVPWRARLTDFGISRMATGANLTRMTSVVGTPEYMAPELYDAEKATAAADVYSTAVMLYELLAGRTPYAGGSPVLVMRRQMDFDPPVIPGLESGLWEILLRMLDKSPVTRPDSARALAQDLELLLPRLKDIPSLPPMGPPDAAGWTPTGGERRTGHSLGPGLHLTQVTPRSAIDLHTHDTVLTQSRTSTPVETLVMDLTGPKEVTPSAVTDRPRRARARVMLAAGAAIAAAAGVVLWMGQKSTEQPDDAVTWVFAPVVRQDGLAINRQWQLRGQDGTSLHQQIDLSNSARAELRTTFDDVIPKEVARDARNITFAPSPSRVIKNDPVVRYEIILKPGQRKILRFDTTLRSGEVSTERLSALARAQIAAEAAYGKSGRQPHAALTLRSLTASRSTLALRVGGYTFASATGLLTNGKPAPEVMLGSLGWSSSNSEVASVQDGNIMAHKAGTAVITVQAGTLRDTIRVTVKPRVTSQAGKKVQSPSAPRAVTAVAGNSEVTVRWQKPASAGGDTITGYLVLSSSGGQRCQAKPGQLSCTLTNLTNGAEYTFTVQATNSAGLGAVSTSPAVKPSGPPAIPWNLRQTDNSQTAIRLNWSDPSSNGSPIDVITVSNQQTGRACTAGPGVGTCVVDGLNPGTNYTFVVKAHNRNGDSPWSAEVAGATQARPRTLWVGVGGSAPRGENGCNICNYIDVVASGFRPNTAYTVTFSHSYGGDSWSGNLTTDANGNYSGVPVAGGKLARYGLWGCSVWATVDGVGSNHQQFPVPSGYWSVCK